jgi:hypothetical protein
MWFSHLTGTASTAYRVYSAGCSITNKIALRYAFCPCDWYKWTRVRSALTRVWSALTRACSALTRVRSALTRARSALTRVQSELTRVRSALTRVRSASTRVRSALIPIAEPKFVSVSASNPPSPRPSPPLIRGERAGSGGILHAQQFVNFDGAIGITLSGMGGRKLSTS